MKVNVYLSDRGRLIPRYGFLQPQNPVSLLPRDENWKYLRSGDTAELGLPEVVDEEIERHGYWAYVFGDGSSLVSF